MADPVAPSMPRGKNGQVPHWFLMAGGLVAIVALFVFMKNKQSATGGSTVAAGTSINAALGSIQEEILNAQGTSSAEHTAMLKNLSDQNAVINEHITHVGTGLQNQVLSGEAILYQGQTWQMAGPNDPRIGEWGQQAGDYAKAAQASLDDQSAAHLASAASGTH